MSKTKNNIRVLLTIGMIALVLSTVIPTRNVKAGSVITVNSTLDKVGNDDECTLREAIIPANKDKASGSKPRECKAGNGFDEVIIPAGTYTLTRTDQGKEDSSSTGDLDIPGLSENLRGWRNSHSDYCDLLW